jgi:hypothetical protein
MCLYEVRSGYFQITNQTHEHLARYSVVLLFWVAARLSHRSAYCVPFLISAIFLSPEAYFPDLKMEAECFSESLHHTGRCHIPEGSTVHVHQYVDVCFRLLYMLFVCSVSRLVTWEQRIWYSVNTPGKVHALSRKERNSHILPWVGSVVSDNKTFYLYFEYEA